MTRRKARPAPVPALGAEDLARLLEDISLDGVFRFDSSGVITYGSPSACEQLGVARGTLEGRHFGEFFSPETFPGAAAVFERAASGERVGLIAITATRSDGTQVPLEVAATPIVRDGRIEGVLGVSRDISARARAEAGLLLYRERLEQLLEERSDELRQAFERFDRYLTDRLRIEGDLRESAALFRSIADNAPVMIFATDTHLQVSYCNRAWLEFRGRSFEEERGRGWTAGVDRATLAVLDDTLRNASSRREHFRVESRMLRADGATRLVRLDGAPRCGPDGEFAGFVGCAVDVTEQSGET